MATPELYFYDPFESFTVLERRLPHWSQSGVVTFITFRTHDSLPSEVLQRFHADRRHWLRCHRINPDLEEWREQLRELTKPEQSEFYRCFSDRWDRELDQGAGQCVFERSEFSKIVADSLLHFDGNRYELTDFVVMPNHVHLLVAFPDEQSLLSQCESRKRFTARQINLRLGTKGRFWQRDGFDHMVRSVEQFEYFRRYIAENPAKAGCTVPETGIYSKRF